MTDTNSSSEAFPKGVKEEGGAGWAGAGGVPDFTACRVCGKEGHEGKECEDLFQINLPVEEGDVNSERAFYLVRAEEDFISTDNALLDPDPDRVVRVSYVDLKRDKGRAADNTEPFLVERSLCADSDYRNKIMKAGEKVVAAAAAKEARSPASLWKAAQYGHGDEVRRFLSDGANINERAGPLKSTPLHEASWSATNAAAYTATKQFSAQGLATARPSPCNMGRKLLVVQQLLEARADVFARDKNGDMPLDYARRQGHVQLARVLRDAEVPPPAAPSGNGPAVILVFNRGSSLPSGFFPKIAQGYVSMVWPHSCDSGCGLNLTPLSRGADLRLAGFRACCDPHRSGRQRSGDRPMTLSGILWAAQTSMGEEGRWNQRPCTRLRGPPYTRVVRLSTMVGRLWSSFCWSAGRTYLPRTRTEIRH